MSLQATWIHVQPAGDPTTGLVEVRDLRGGELLAGDGQEPLQTGGRVREQRGQPARGDRGAERFLQALRGAFHRQVLAAQQIHREGRDARAVTGRGGCLSRKLRAGDRTAVTFASLRAVLDRDQLDHWEVKHLTRLDAHHGCVRQVSSAPEASRRGMDPDLIRHLPRLQPEPLPNLLLTRLASRGLAQRLRCRLAQPVAARWLRGVPGVLAQPRFQRRDQRIALGQRNVPLSEQHQQLLQRRGVRNR